MIVNTEIEKRRSIKKFEKELTRRKRKKATRRKLHEGYIRLKCEFDGAITYEKMIDKWLPLNLRYLLSCDKAGFMGVSNVQSEIHRVPKKFSLIDNPKESYNFIKQLVASILIPRQSEIKLDYSDCKNIDLGAQIFLDVIMKDIIKFINKCKSAPLYCPAFPGIVGVNIFDQDIKKMLFSVGSPAVHNKNRVHFKDILPYRLCIHNKESNANSIKNSERKEIDSTKLVDYVIDSLERLDKKLTPEKIEDLSTVIGEILINAEEHSTTRYRFSTGYFQEYNGGEGDTYGILHLVIMNFGETIYEKFKSPKCENKKIIQKMSALSSKYTNSGLFNSSFEEETLWTLYALQEGITSVSTSRYKRGNGSIRFIESFFNIKGIDLNSDSISRMTILSGNTNITFDGKYNILNKKGENGKDFKIMTFNKSGSLEDKPDKKYVKYVKEYFPGTLISARILFNKDDMV